MSDKINPQVLKAALTIVQHIAQNVNKLPENLKDIQGKIRELADFEELEIARLAVELDALLKEEGRGWDTKKAGIIHRITAAGKIFGY
jgi:hypothetical protein